MFDITLRPLKDSLFDPICNLVPQFITPLHITGLAFLSGVACCIAAARASTTWTVALWALNRGLDCLDGAVARQRKQTSELGGFLDLLGDFIVYSAIPICCTFGSDKGVPMDDCWQLRRRWLAVAVAESSFHINNFVLFFLAAVVERGNAQEVNKGGSRDKPTIKTKELTSVTMKSALVEGFESGLAFTCMLALPGSTEAICWILSAGVIVGIVQRTKDAVFALSKP